MVTTVTIYKCDCCEQEIKDKNDLVKLSIGFSDIKCLRYHGHIVDSELDYRFEICKDCLESFGLIPYKQTALNMGDWGHEILERDANAIKQNQSILKKGVIMEIIKKLNIFKQ